MSGLYTKVGIQRMGEGGTALDSDSLALESLVKLSDPQGVFVSLLATPDDMKALFVGHCITEGYGYVDHESISITSSIDIGFEIVSTHRLPHRSKIPDRQGIVSTSCGACDSPGLVALLEGLPPFLGNHVDVDLPLFDDVFSTMRARQLGFEATGGMHGAGLWSAKEGLLYVAEDIGRHNAVDKVIGMAAMNQIHESDSLLFLSGRCGWDIVAKAARSGIGTIACVGACSSLAAETARALGMRIYSFLKPTKGVAIGRLEPSTNGKP